ncbi:MAG: hypothetical protein Q9O62_03745 [Ardenticatenia bacterium]|nr:hypothetical protein [Ardenticatenia bacterium]
MVSTLSVTVTVPYEALRKAIQLCHAHALQLRREGAKDPRRLRYLLDTAGEYERVADQLEKALRQALDTREVGE